MSSTKHKNTDPRKLPVSGQNSAKSGKAKTSKSKVSKTIAAAKPLSNGVHEVVNGVDTRKSSSGKSESEGEIAKINLLTLQKVDKSVLEILTTVPHVILYEFKTEENIWVSAIDY